MRSALIGSSQENAACSLLDTRVLNARIAPRRYYQQRELPIGVGPDDFPETLFHQWRARAQELGVSDLDLLSTLTDHR